MNADIHYRKPDQYIALLEIDHLPANSLSKGMKTIFNQRLDEIEQDPDIRVLIITGSGTKFCTGDDLKEASKSAGSERKIIENLRAFTALMDRIDALPISVIASINGWAIGGGLELALCCDIRLAATTAKFASSGVSVGLIASATRLPRLIGLGRAKHMLLSGNPIDAEKAASFGLVSGVFEPSELLPASLQLAKQIAEMAPLAIQATKRMANLAFDLPISDGNALQQSELEKLAKTADYREALAAFAEKRTPGFRGM